MQSKGSSCCGESKTVPQRPDEIKEFVKSRYGRMISDQKRGSCCGPGDERIEAKVAPAAGYTDEELAQVPAHAVEHSLGCGNPVALAGLQPGQTVLDIGSGAGIDVLLAARKVGPQGRVIGLDLTPEMIQVAEKNAADAGVTNAEFRLGDAENMPVESETVDWIISNCVINLAPDKEKVFREAYRVLRPGGRMLISDIVTKNLPQEIRQSAQAWAACVAGAIEEDDYLDAMRRAGFAEVEVVARLDYDEDSILAILDCSERLSEELADFAPALGGRIASIRVSAVKP